MVDYTGGESQGIQQPNLSGMQQPNMFQDMLAGFEFATGFMKTYRNAKDRKELDKLMQKRFSQMSENEIARLEFLSPGMVQVMTNWETALSQMEINESVEERNAMNWRLQQEGIAMGKMDQMMAAIAKQPDLSKRLALWNSLPGIYKDDPIMLEVLKKAEGFTINPKTGKQEMTDDVVLAMRHFAMNAARFYEKETAQAQHENELAKKMLDIKLEEMAGDYGLMMTWAEVFGSVKVQELKNLGELNAEKVKQEAENYRQDVKKKIEMLKRGSMESIRRMQIESDEKIKGMEGENAVNLEEVKGKNAVNLEEVKGGNAISLEILKGGNALSLEEVKGKNANELQKIKNEGTATTAQATVDVKQIEHDMLKTKQNEYLDFLRKMPPNMPKYYADIAWLTSKGWYPNKNGELEEGDGTPASQTTYEEAINDPYALRAVKAANKVAGNSSTISVGYFLDKQSTFQPPQDYDEVMGQATGQAGQTPEDAVKAATPPTDPDAQSSNQTQDSPPNRTLLDTQASNRAIIGGNQHTIRKNFQYSDKETEILNKMLEQLPNQESLDPNKESKATPDLARRLSLLYDMGNLEVYKDPVINDRYVITAYETDGSKRKLGSVYDNPSLGYQLNFSPGFEGLKPPKKTEPVQGFAGEMPLPPGTPGRAEGTIPVGKIDMQRQKLNLNF